MVSLMSNSETKRRFGRQPDDPAPNKSKKYAAEVLSSEELAALIALCSRQAPTGVRNRAMIMLLSRSGLRVSEMLGDPTPGRNIPPMRASGVDFKTHSIRLLNTKSGHPQTRGFHPSVDDALLRWMEARKQLGLARNGAPLFCTLEGEPVSRQYTTQMLKRLAGKAGIDKRVHPHGLRHTFAVELLREGVDVVTISKLLGHSSISVTNRYLDHLTNEEAISVLVAIDLPPLEGRR